VRRCQLRLIPPIIQTRNLVEEAAFHRHLGIVVDRAPIRIRVSLLDHLIDASASVVHSHILQSTNTAACFQLRDLGDIWSLGFGVEARTGIQDDGEVNFGVRLCSG
jgi:hypothetical protein